MPHELVWGEIYFPPLLLALIIAYGLMWGTTALLIKLGFAEVLAHPVITEFCLLIIYLGLVGQFIVFV